MLKLCVSAFSSQLSSVSGNKMLAFRIGKDYPTKFPQMCLQLYYTIGKHLFLSFLYYHLWSVKSTAHRMWIKYIQCTIHHGYIHLVSGATNYKQVTNYFAHMTTTFKVYFRQDCFHNPLQRGNVRQKTLYGITETQKWIILRMGLKLLMPFWSLLKNSITNTKVYEIRKTGRKA